MGSRGVMNVGDCWKRQIRLSLQRRNQTGLILQGDREIEVLTCHCKRGPLGTQLKNGSILRGKRNVRGDALTKSLSMRDLHR